MRTFICACVALALCMLPMGGLHADKIEVYVQGQKINFGLAHSRMMCNSVFATKMIISDIKKRFGDKAAPFLWRPLTEEGASPGNMLIRPEIADTMPVTTAIMTSNCVIAQKELTILDPVAIEWVGTDEITTVIVMINDGRTYVTWFINTRILSPIPGTPAALAYIDALSKSAPKKPAAASHSPRPEENI